MPTGRAFVAVVPPPAVLDAVEPVAERVCGHLHDARCTPRPQWHLTLQFLGNRVDLDAVAGALGSLVHAPFGVRLAGLGAFPNPRRARVVWVGVGEGRAELEALAGAVEAVLAPTGFVAEERAHQPHLTLARLRTPAPVVEIVEAGGAPGGGAIGPAWGVGEVVLFESVTRREGAEHRPVVAVPLEGA